MQHHLPALARPAPSRRLFLSTGAAALAAMAWGTAGTAHALGQRVDVAVIDRDTGETLTVYTYRGQHYIAGRPGARYAIRVGNRTGGRVLAVVSVDGVNVVTGQTAAWHQSGYVLAPWQSYDIAGWRKSQEEVAAFEFTALPDSYAARTGRPLDVGVIGVAVFTERPLPPPPPPAPMAEPAEIGRAESRRSAPAAADAGAAAKAAPESLTSAQPAERLGTGHGAREHSQVTHTQFERSSRRPVETLSLQYDRHENLARAGVIPPVNVATPRPRPFPRSPDLGYVPDPPAR
jgi:hypothetical protein